MTTITYTTEDGEEHELTIEKVSGRGEIGDMNWGAKDPSTEEELKPMLAELMNHIDEPVVLTGGGSRGHDIGILEDAAIEHVGWGPEKGQFRIRASVTLISGKITRHGRHGEEFNPWLGSWQISVFPDEGDRRLAEEYVATEKAVRANESATANAAD